MSVRTMASDPRTRRTLAHLTDAMNRLLATGPIGEVNVSELCRLAGVHRTTFYKHFSSVTEFVTDFYSTLLDDITELSEDELPADRDSLVEAYHAMTVSLLDHIAANRFVYARLFAADGDFRFQRIVLERMSQRAADAHRRLVARGTVLGTDELTAARMVGGAVAAALGVWAGEDGQQAGDSTERADQIMAALPPWWPQR